MTSVFDLLAQSEAYQAGQWMGRILMVVLIVGVIVWAIQRNKKK